MKDRFMKGLMAGLISYIPTWFYNHYARSYFHFSKIGFSDFASNMLLGNLPKNNLELWFARFGTGFFLGLCGILFVFLISRGSGRYIFLKAWYFAVLIWFSSYAITKLFKVQELASLDLNTAISNLIGASIWGISVASVLLYFDKREKLKSK